MPPLCYNTNNKMASYILEQKTIENISNQLRTQGKKVIFTHGSFDLLHIGHSHLLNISKKKGDTLIVGIESDERIRKYKNPDRPIIPDKARIAMLLDHRAVDFVLHIQGDVPWTNAYYLNLYKRLFPTMITYGKTHLCNDRFKESEYKLEGIMYKQINEVQIETGSTSKIIEKINKSYFSANKLSK